MFSPTVNVFIKKLTVGFLLGMTAGYLNGQAQGNEVILNTIRVQMLAEDLVRIEQKGPVGFEDRITFTVVDRTWQGAPVHLKKSITHTILESSKIRILVPIGAASLKGIEIQKLDGKILYTFQDTPPVTFLPGPSSETVIWVMPDDPRLIPPPWGAVPVPEGMEDVPDFGWDTGNNAQDVYVFLLEPGEYSTFRRHFLKLTGPIPMPPLFAFGLWNSRYHPYSEETALETIDTYREKNIPLDVFVVDTDWRIGASHGYGVNDSLFPDMRRFIRRAHEKQVRLMYNDHPEPQAASALDPREIKYRWNGLTGLLDMGIDVWWYDRNWNTGLHEPVSGISKEVWGMRLYHDITRVFHPDRRPLIMSNVDGIDNGIWNTPSHPASHRYPIWWTGDQKSRWEYLEMGVSNGVNSGIARMMPYVNEDLGGHTAGNPDPEQYVRWVQFGAFSPVTRLHCTRGLTRYPWDYGDEAERIASEYIRLRYRLLPELYAAARRAYEDGTPVMQRCDLEWPDEPEAKRDLQYLFGEDLLIAPIALGRTRDIPLESNLLKTDDGKPGLSGVYYANQTLEGDPVLIRVDSTLNFVWGSGSPDPMIPDDHFSVRWTGKIGPFNEDSSFHFKVISDDGVRVWVRDSLMVDAWQDQAPADFPMALNVESGQSYDIRIEFYENAGGAHLQLVRTVDVEQIFKAWIPPGTWQDVWTGEMVSGPQTLILNPVLWKCPMYVRSPGMIFSVPQMQYTSEQPWNTVIIDAYMPVKDSEKIIRTLYEDDGISPNYQIGEFCKTRVTLTRIEKNVNFLISGMLGDYNGALEERDWVIRLHLPYQCEPKNIRVNEIPVQPNDSDQVRLITQTESREDLMPFLGPGSLPRIRSGSILEVHIDDQDTGEPVWVYFEI